MKSRRRIKRSARQLFRACLVDGGLDEGRARFVAGRLAESSRRGALAILSSFQRLVRLDRDRHTAFVESATPLAGPMAIDADQIDEAKVEAARARAAARLQDKISDEEVASVNASLARSLAQLQVKRRRRG